MNLNKTIRFQLADIIHCLNESLESTSLQRNIEKIVLDNRLGAIIGAGIFVALSDIHSIYAAHPKKVKNFLTRDNFDFPLLSDWNNSKSFLKICNLYCWIKIAQGEQF